MRNVFLSVFILVFITISIAGAQPDAGAEYLTESVATVDRALAGLINPAGLGYFSSMGLLYAHTFSDSAYKGDDGAMISSRGSFFAIEWLNHDTDIFRRKYTLAMGDGILPNFYVGLSYSWFGGADKYYKGKKDWKFGMLYRPRPMVSMGLVVDRINQPKFGDEKMKRMYIPGLAIRPFGEKFTISSDAHLLEGDDLTDIHSSIRTAIGSFHGVSLAVEYRSEGQWRLGMTFDFETTRIGGQGRFKRESEWNGGTYSMEVGMLRFGETVGPTGKSASIVLNDDIVEEPRQASIFGGRKRSTLSVINSLRKGASDPRITSLLIKFEGMKLNFATAQELRQAISEYRENGKKVTAFIGIGGNLDYYLASSADEIYMEPTGLLELKGLAVNARFYKGTMDKLGVKAQVLQTGPHKDYGSAFTDTMLTPSSREQIDWLLDDLYAQFVEGISSGRRILPENVKRLIDSGPYSAEGAYRAGLVDGLKHFDELTGDNNDGPIKIGQVGLIEFYSVRDYNPRWSEPKKIAVVYADGSILSGRNGQSLLEGKTIGDETLAKTLKKIRHNNEIKAVVFRVNSPGGDVFASERIYRQLELLKGKKPLVVSMGGVAASGGYYISCPGDEIMASPATITGSIGVVMGKIDMSGFYDKIGIKNETIKRGEHADIRSTSRPASDNEMAMIDTMLWEFYGDFINKVATWRKLDPDSVDAIGQGRVWTGRQALERGLIDSFGGIWEAVEQARQKAKIDPEDEIIIESFPVYGFSILPSFGVQSLESQFSSLLERTGDEGYYFRAPFELDIK